MWGWVSKSATEKDKEVHAFQEKYSSPLLTFLARIASFCSDEEFYLISFPLCVWGPMCDGTPLFAFGIAQLLAWNLTIGSTVKNLIAYPRPSHPVRRESGAGCEAIEFGMPSTHAFMSMSFAMHIVYHLWSQTAEPTLFNYATWFIFTVLWSGSIGFSRVYLGYHTLQDIAVGWITGFFWTILMELYIIPFLFVAASTRDIVTLVAVSIMWGLWLIFHPFNKDSKVLFHLSEGTYDYVPPIIAVGLASTWGIYRVGAVGLPCSTDYSTLLVRYGVGLPVTGIVFFLCRAVLPPIIERVFKMLNLDIHYVPYGKFKQYIVEAIKNPSNTINGDYKMAWVRYATKFLQYTFLTACVEVFAFYQ